jgi:hypothetical protein
MPGNANSGGHNITTSNLSENAAGSCTLHATDGSLTAGDSNSFTITAPPGGRGKFAIIH